MVHTTIGATSSERGEVEDRSDISLSLTLEVGLGGGEMHTVKYK